MPPKKSSEKEDGAVKEPKDTSLNDLRRLLETNIKWTEIVHADIEKLNKRFMWSQLAGLAKVLIILIPLIAGLIYLVPFIQKGFSTYLNLLGNVSDIIEAPKAPTQQGAGQPLPFNPSELLKKVPPDVLQDFGNILKAQ